MNKFLTLSVVAVALALNGCKSVSTSTDATAPAAAKSGFMGLTTNADLTVTTPAAFKETGKVVIGGFKVAFVESKRDSAKAGGGLLSSGFGGKSTALMMLNGIDSDTKQAITDKAYADFISTLKAEGFTVTDRKQYTSTPEYVKTKTYDSPYTTDSSMLSKYGTTTYYQPTGFEAMRIYMGEIDKVMGGIGFSHPNNAAVAYTSETGNKLLNVVYVIDFSNADASGGSFKSTSFVKVGQGLSLQAGTSKMQLIGGHAGTFSTANGSIALGQPIYSLEKFGDVVSASSNTEKTVEKLTNVASLLGGMGSNITTKFDVNADAEKYQAVALEITGKANEAIVGKMKSLK